MKKILFLFTLSLVVVSCKPKEKKNDVYKNYPKQLAEVLKKHGGLDNWKLLQVLSFKKGEETHTTDLHSRKTVITSPKYSLGFDGKDVWVSDTTAFKSNPKFYYNLFFYFYAMPYVLADDGIQYEETKPLLFKGKSYPGYKISFNADKGSSPDDNYYVYYNKETNQMEWLGYTVTYFSKESTDKKSLIKYDKWEDVNGFLLPKELVWYKQDENGNPTEPAREPVVFTNATASQGKLADRHYQNPAAE